MIRTRRHDIRILRVIALALGLWIGTVAVAAPAADPDAARLAASLATLDADPTLADRARLERF